MHKYLKNTTEKYVFKSLNVSHVKAKVIYCLAICRRKQDVVT